MKIGFLFPVIAEDEELLKKGEWGQYFLFDLLSKIVEAGNEIVLITLNQNKTEDSVFQFNEAIKVYSLKPSFSTTISSFFGFTYETKRVENILKQENCDVIHAHWCYEYAQAGLNCDKSKTVITLHDWPDAVGLLLGDIVWKNRRKFGNRVIKQSNILIAVSEIIKEKCEKKFVGKDVRLIPNFIDVHENSKIIKNEDFTIISVNNGFNDLKNTRTLMKAFSIVKRTCPNAKLLLCGWEHEAGGKAETWAKENGMSEGISFLGFKNRNEIMELIEKSSVLVSTSVEESFGLTLIEAMSVKTYVIGGEKSGAVPWVLGYGEYGSLIDVMNEENIAKELLSVKEDPVGTTVVVEKAFNYVRETFSTDVIAKKHLELYDEIYKKSRGII